MELSVFEGMNKNELSMIEVAHAILEQTYQMQNQKGEVYELHPTEFPISERTSNGSMMMNETDGGDVTSVEVIFPEPANE